jgi:hypothetical protein
MAGTDSGSDRYGACRTFGIRDLQVGHVIVSAVDALTRREKPKAYTFNLSRIREPIFGPETVTIIVTTRGKIRIHGDIATRAESAT